MTDDELLSIVTGDGAFERFTVAPYVPPIPPLRRRNLYALYIVPDANWASVLRKLLLHWKDTTPIVVDARACDGDILAVPRGHPLLEPYNKTRGTDGHS